MRQEIYALATAMLLLISTSAYAGVNKCKGPDGKIVYQDTPCPGDGRALEIQRQPMPPSDPPQQSQRPPVETAPAARKQVDPRLAEQEEIGQKMRETNARLADLQYKDCVNRKKLIQSRAAACRLGTCPNVVMAYQQAEFLKLYGADLPEDCETINPQRPR